MSKINRYFEKDRLKKWKNILNTIEMYFCWMFVASRKEKDDFEEYKGLAKVLINDEFLGTICFTMTITAKVTCLWSFNDISKKMYK